MFKINTNRKIDVVYESEDKETSFSITMEAIASEDQNMEEIRKKLGSLGDTDLEGEVEGSDKVSHALNFLHYSLRKSIIGCKDILDLDGNPVSLKKEDGTINEDIQKALYDHVSKLSGFLGKMVTAYNDISGKNEKSGATQQ